MNEYKVYYRVLRGGSWYDYDYDCKVSRRCSDNPNGRDLYSGFRVIIKL